MSEELKLYEAVVMWAQQQHFDAQQSEDALSQLLPLIRFPLMSLEELQVCYQSDGYLCALSFYLHNELGLVGVFAAYMITRISLASKLWPGCGEEPIDRSGTDERPAGRGSGFIWLQHQWNCRGPALQIHACLESQCAASLL